MLMLTSLLLTSSVAAGAARRTVAAPQPQLGNITYYGSACPEADASGLKISIGSFSALNASANVAPLNFTLSDGTPNFGSFGSSLRMCDILADVAIDPGWKAVVNAHGTQVQGLARLTGNTTLGVRATYQFADHFETQSVGMLNMDGPVSGQFLKQLQAADGDKGVTSSCGGGQLVIEFESMAVNSSAQVPMKLSSNETTWIFSTDIQLLRC